MATKHTPGPWRIFWGRDGNTYPLNIWGPVGSDHAAFRSVVTSFGRKASDESTANANLIAAAPELLEALKAILDTTAFAHDEPEAEVHQRALSAIRKAEGAL